MYRSLLALVALAGMVFPASAQVNYPQRPVMMVVPFAAGGPLDIVARIVAESMSRELGQNVLVENVGGAGGTIGAARVAKAKPDGYTVLMYHIGLATSPALYKGRLAFDPISDLKPVGLVNEVAMTIIVRPDLSVKSLSELIASLNSNSDAIKVANAGVGSASHLCTLLIERELGGARLNAVPYRGTGLAMTDLLGGHVDVICDLVTSASSAIQSGRVNALAVTTKSRLRNFPDVPTTAEAGSKSIEMTNWNAILAPANTPDPIVAKLSGALRAALADPKVIEKLHELGSAPIEHELSTPDALARHLSTEIARWTPIIEAAGVQAQQ